MKKEIELKILIGASGSGKSTWARDFVRKNDNWCIVSRDDLRYAWQNKGVVENKIESLITKMVEVQIDSLIRAKVNVIYDATNLKAKYIKEISEIVRNIAKVNYQIFDVPKDVCIQRDLSRERKVGSEVIEKQFKNYLVLLDSFDFSPINPIVKKYITPKFDSNKYLSYIFDIDGTLAHTSGKRSPYDFSMVEVDDVDHTVKRILSNLHTLDYKIVIVTGRDESCRKETETWLNKNGMEFHELLMRKEGDSRKDHIIKEEIFWNDIEPKYNVLAVFDDRDSVVKMWRSLGIKCFQCEYGNF